MTRPTTIKVIKRGQLERSEEKTETGTTVELNDRATRRDVAATVEGWVAEFEKSRQTGHLTLKRQLGW